MWVLIEAEAPTLFRLPEGAAGKQAGAGQDPCDVEGAEETVSCEEA